MFTGIIEKVSRVKDHWQEGDSLFLEIEKPSSWQLKPGSSVATDGVCLTVREVKDESYITELMKETLKKTGFGQRVPKFLNLEKSLKAGEPIDGHFVLGHVDTIGRIEKLERGQRSWVLEISYPESDQALIIPHGSVAINGVSLTVAEKSPATFKINLVDFTVQNTTFKDSEEGDLVNLEYDMLGKYALNKLNKI